MAKHAVLSPSGSHTWLFCLASPWMQKGLKSESEFATEGSLAHELAKKCLDTDSMALDFVGLPFIWEKDGKQRTDVITKDMAEFVDVYCDNIREAAKGKVLYVEVALPIGQITGTPDDEGTGDAIILDNDTLEISDLKYGLGVPVSAYKNTQMLTYALAAIDYFSWFGTFKRIRIVIHQVRLGDPSVWECSIEELEAFREFAVSRAGIANQIMEDDGLDELPCAPEAYFYPYKSTCKFCKRSGICKAQEQAALKTTIGEFTEIEDAPAGLSLATEEVRTYSPERLGLAAEAIPFLKDYIKAVDTQLNATLSSGVKVPGWKLAMGRAGNSKWSAVDAVIKILQRFKLPEDDIYDKEIISPTTAKKRFEKKNKLVWEAIKSFISREDGRPNAVPDTDPRPEYKKPNAQDDFTVSDDVEEE